MGMSTTRARHLLKGFDFRQLFIEELGWDKHQALLDVTVSNQKRTLVALPIRGA
jgi:hypothetical protein